jgi:nicotinamide-nucleotide amidase
MTPVRVELLVVGDELLSGRTVDSNSAWLGRQLATVGLTPARVIRIGDDELAIRAELAQASGRARVVFVLGGLGPTPDDRTAAAVAAFCGRRLVTDRRVLTSVRARFGRIGTAMPAVAARQALVIDGARLIHNPVGMVPGMIVGQESAKLVLLPGVPQELMALYEVGVRQWLVSEFRLAVPHERVIRTIGVAESRICQRATSLLRRHVAVEPSFYPSTGGVDVVLRSASGREVDRCVRGFECLLGRHVYSTAGESLAEVVGRSLVASGMSVATAESCTGGLVSDRLTDVPGSSSFFLGGVIGYSSAVKMSVLGVSERTLREHGAVSSLVVRQMAGGARRRLGSDVSIAVSGVAGPGGATAQKPVGLVYLAVDCRGRARVERWLFAGNRRMVKERAAAAALDLCRRVLSER